MPFTPFHFGVGAAFHATSPGKISFLAFCASNVVTDVEPLYYMLNGEAHVHRFLHTVLGATFSWIVTFILFLLLIRLGSRINFPNWFRWRDLTPLPIALGAALGTYSHLILDGMMQRSSRVGAPPLVADVRPRKT
jgi:branched-subunit amino acid transport protein